MQVTRPRTCVSGTVSAKYGTHWTNCYSCHIEHVDFRFRLHEISIAPVEV